MKNNHEYIVNLIHDFVEGKLSEDESDSLWAHLIANPVDLEYMQTLATLKKMGHEGKFATLDKQFDHNTKTRILPFGSGRIFGGYIKHYLAAAAVLLVSMGILFNIFGDQVIQSEFSPIAMIEFEIERSAGETNDFETVLNSAVSYSSAGDANLALDLLNSISTEALNPGEIMDIYMVKGSVYYNAGNYSEAIESFESVLKMDPGKLTLEKSYWYIANAQLQLGMENDARENIKKVIEIDGAFSRVAVIALEKL